jgi:hypothetical protein
MKFDLTEAKERFEDFLMAMDDQLEWLENEGRANGIFLNLQLTDLPRLETLFNILIKGKDKDEAAGLVVTFARYLGEVVVKNFGGHWRLSLDDSKSANFNTPVIAGHSNIPDLEFAPLSVMRAFSLRKREGTLRVAVEAQTHPKPLDLSGLIEKS